MSVEVIRNTTQHSIFFYSGVPGALDLSDHGPGKDGLTKPQDSVRIYVFLLCSFAFLKSFLSDLTTYFPGLCMHEAARGFIVCKNSSIIETAS